jgi:hypothetical protein
MSKNSIRGLVGFTRFGAQALPNVAVPHGILYHSLVRYKYGYLTAFSMSKKEQEVNTSPSPSQMQRDHQEAINKTFDQTKNNVRKTVSEAKKDISVYSEQFANLQERAIETTRDITESYLESQREIFNSFNQEVVTPYIENIVNRTPSFPGAFSPSRAEVYGNTFTNMIDNFVTATRLINKTVSANAGLINASLQQASNNAREYSRIGVNAAKNVHETANELAKIGISVVEYTTAATRRNQ